MQYRRFPRVDGLEISTLGFGAMRLPVIDKDPTRIDEEAAIALLHQAIDAGVNYIDTAWVYHGGNSERLVGRALAQGKRDRVQVATKFPVWEMQAEDDFMRILALQLERLQTGHVDFYLLHALNRTRWAKVKGLGILSAMQRAKREGLVKHIGFSFHGSLAEFKSIIDDYPDWELTLIQLNYLDQAFQAGLHGLAYAHARRIGVLAMEPLRGGVLATAPPEVAHIYADSDRPWSPAEWALRWVWSLPGVVSVLSGMNQSQQLAENVATASHATPLTAQELTYIDRVRRFYRQKIAVPCTTCGYCQPCPSSVAIADVFNLWNSGRMFEARAKHSTMYRNFVLDQGLGADKCVECRDCEPRCPQSIAIPERLQAAHSYLVSP